ncbi:MAG: TIGR01458 family HAD-type hydrolase [Ketobacteraceae bacterium]|nr:TIGR01458 family HAD-type hydrolase [Ketobacteraceae bacterium]
MLKAILFDLSGVLYDGDQVIDGAVDAIERVQDTSLDIRFITNTSQKTRQRILDGLKEMGFSISDSQVYTATEIAKQWLEENDRRPYCLVHKQIREEFDELDQSDPNAVLIGDAGEDFTFANLNRAFQLCQQGAVLAGIGYNRYYSQDDQLMLDAGPFIKAIEFAADTEATILGKPSETFFEQVLATTGAKPEEALMIGDDVFGDVEGAIKAGLQGCLVRTGKYQQSDEDKISGDFFVAGSIVDAVEHALKQSD